MAFDPQYKMSIQNETGDYYSATLSVDGIWNISTSSVMTFLKTLPDGWADIAIDWERDRSYLGIQRSKSAETLKFSKDARAIIQHIISTEGIIGYGLLTIYLLKEDATSFTYPIYYKAEFDFKSCPDDMTTNMISVGLLDSGLYRDVYGRGDTKMNVPVWTNTAAAGDPPTWVLNGAEWMLHPGIKVRYQASYTGAASVDNLVKYHVSESHQLNGWNKGARGDGYHILPVMNQYNVIQNNGATTFIGNDILAPFLIQGNQVPGAANFGSESNFSDTNHSQPWTRNNFTIKNLLPNTPFGGLTMWASVSGSFNPGTSVSSDFFYSFTDATKNPYFAMVLFEINTDDSPDVVASRYVNPQIIYRFDLSTYPFPAVPGPTDILIGQFGGQNDTRQGTINNPASVTINYNKVYCFGFICDNDDGFGSSEYCSFLLSDLNLFLTSKWDSGASGVPIPSPSFPESVFAGFRLHKLFEKVVSYLPTTQTDGYGFPIPITTPYTFRSDFLSNPALPPIKDCVPYQVMISSAYCIHDLEGQSYVTASLNQLFDFCKKRWGCAMAIEADPVTGEQTVLRVEPLSHFLDSSTELLDLDRQVSKFTIDNDQTIVAANLKAGYSKADTNSDFGVDPFCSSLFFNTPATNVRGTMDFEEAGILTEMYAIEKLRAQKVSQPIGASYDPASPSDDNQAIAIYVSGTTAPAEYPVEDPSRGPLSVFPYPAVQHSDAQSTDPSASSAAYIFGLYYPDTAINVELSPCRAFQTETGAYLHSVLGTNMDALYLTFRNTTVMQFNNEVAALSGIESNLEIGSGSRNVTTEFKDILIGGLPSPLFQPRKVSVETNYPANFYQILNSNPNGYIKFLWNKEYGFDSYVVKLFVNKITQAAAVNKPTVLSGWITVDTVI